MRCILLFWQAYPEERRAVCPYCRWVLCWDGRETFFEAAKKALEMTR